jgi:hypothetical protein
MSTVPYHALSRAFWISAFLYNNTCKDYERLAYDLEQARQGDNPILETVIEQHHSEIVWELAELAQDVACFFALLRD